MDSGLLDCPRWVRASYRIDGLPQTYRSTFPNCRTRIMSKMTVTRCVTVLLDKNGSVGARTAFSKTQTRSWVILSLDAIVLLLFL